MLGEGPIGDINYSVGAAEKMCCVNFSKAKTSFYSSLNYSGDSYLLVVTEKPISLIRIIKI